jgi:hypothetical protein
MSYEQRILGYIMRPTGEDQILNDHLEIIGDLDGRKLKAYEHDVKTLFDLLHVTLVAFGKEHAHSCLCVVHQGTRGLAHRVALDWIAALRSEV